ncbi:UDP-N-acetylmuramoyl-L-alanine--D-glutamate ligase [Candidatus Nomurabacteria bacterium]|nr:UDP-N-acetylmuramoyl-L-alanine--D-glutamate ligase [Candidatus Nomurabacteria bacterium]
MQKKYYEHYFKGKKVTIMGLGLLGRSLQVAQFVAQCGAKVTVTDLKDKKTLEKSISKLKKYKIRYVLGKHDLKDFENVDMVIKAPGVPIDSPYIKHARKNGVDVVMDASLFSRIAPFVHVVGVTGTRGKSITTSAIYHTLKSNEKSLGCSVYSGGNLRGQATLPLLKKVKEGDIVVLELDSWQLQGFGDEKISPNMSVFTSFMQDHMNYYGSTSLTTSAAMKKYFADKANIFKYQTKNDFLVIRPKMKEWINRSDAKGKLIVANKNKISGYKLNVFGDYNLENMACVYEVAKIFDLSDIKIKKSLESFPGLEGRMQFIRSFKGIDVYNDNNSTTPQATVAGIEALVKYKNKKGKIVLIAGGNDKNIDISDLLKDIKKNIKHTFLIPGTGTERLVSSLGNASNVDVCRSLKQAMDKSTKFAERGDVILFSPGFSSFSQYNNEYERNDEFIKLVKRWK